MQTEFIKNGRITEKIQPHKIDTKKWMDKLVYHIEYSECSRCDEPTPEDLLDINSECDTCKNDK